MKVIICGAGQVGRQVGRYLSNEDCDITIIDSDAQLVRQLADRLNIGGITGGASEPAVLQSAGVEDAELLIAATNSDEVNIVTCMFADLLSSKVRTIARVRNQNYHKVVGRSHKGPVDIVISPEREVSEAALRLLSTPSVFDRRNMLDNEVSLIGLRLGEECPVLHTSLRQLSDLFTDLEAIVVGFRRNGHLTVAAPEDQLFASDEIFVILANRAMNRTLQAFGKEHKPCDRVVIIGAGNVGLDIAVALEKRRSHTHTKLIEQDRHRAEMAADRLQKTVVFHGDGLDREILEEAGVHNAQAILAVTEDDKTNLLVATKAKNLSSKLMSISLITEPSLAPLIDALGIDAVIDPRATAVSSILPHIRMRLANSIHSVGDSEAEVIEATISPSSVLKGKTIRQADLPEGARVGALKKNKRVVKLTPDTKIEAGNTAAFFVLSEDVPKVMAMLGTDATKD